MTGRFLMLGALSILAGCADDLCGNRVLQTAISPDGARAAIVFERDCGATTRASIQISILPAGERPYGAGNVFIAEPRDGPTAGPPGEEAEVAWLGPNRLRVRYRATDVVFERADAQDGVGIEYRPIEG